MPGLAAVPAIAWLTAGTAAATAGGMVYGAKQQGKASRQASAVQSRSMSDALDFEKEQDRLDRAEDARIKAQNRTDYDRIEAERRAAWEAEEARLAPRREMSENVLRQWAKELGIAQPPPVTRSTTMPTGWGMADGAAADPSKGAYRWDPPVPKQTPSGSMADAVGSPNTPSTLAPIPTVGQMVAPTPQPTPNQFIPPLAMRDALKYRRPAAARGQA